MPLWNKWWHEKLNRGKTEKLCFSLAAFFFSIKLFRQLLTALVLFTEVWQGEEMKVAYGMEKVDSTITGIRITISVAQQKLFVFA